MRQNTRLNEKYFIIKGRGIIVYKGLKKKGEYISTRKPRVVDCLEKKRGKDYFSQVFFNILPKFILLY
jgi:hypothetical protein